MTRDILAAFAALLAFAGPAAPVLEDFKAVHKAKVERKGTNDVVLVLNSAEWSSGLRWTSDAGADFSRARYLAVDVENLSKTRQGRLTMHLSAGERGGDSDDHATAILRKNRSVNTGIGLNAREFSNHAWNMV